MCTTSSSVGVLCVVCVKLILQVEASHQEGVDSSLGVLASELHLGSMIEWKNIIRCHDDTTAAFISSVPKVNCPDQA
jgi:hypothetical protein